MSPQQDSDCLPQIDITFRYRRRPRLVLRLVVAAVCLGYAPTLMLAGVSPTAVVAVAPVVLSLVARVTLGRLAAPALRRSRPAVG